VIGEGGKIGAHLFGGNAVIGIREFAERTREKEDGFTIESENRHEGGKEEIRGHRERQIALTALVIDREVIVFRRQNQFGARPVKEFVILALEIDILLIRIKVIRGIEVEAAGSAGQRREEVIIGKGDGSCGEIKSATGLVLAGQGDRLA
jgi:hypothetical protein